jgi:hypothetical protein
MLNSRNGSSIDTYQRLEDLLRPATRARTLQKRKRWLDGLISPFAKKRHVKSARSGMTRQQRLSIR